MARTYEFLVGAAEAGARLDRYLASRLPQSVSRALIQRGIRAGTITVADQPVKVHHKLRAGERILASFDQLPPAPRKMPLVPEDLPLSIVYEDDGLLVVNKPAGLVTHPAPGHWTGTLVHAILWHLQARSKENSEFGIRNAGSSTTTPNSELRTPNLARAGIIHRLDKDTSGLLLVAKTPHAHAGLSKQMKSRSIRRRYVAVVEGRLLREAGVVQASIGRHHVHRKEMAVRHLGGRAAVTHYRALQRVGESASTLKAQRYRPSGPTLTGAGGIQPGTASPEPPFPYSVIEVALETGRMHQIRVHMAHVGHPVVGDPTYGRRSQAYWQSFGVARQLLHAYRLTFRHPDTGRDMTLTAPIPEDVARWVDPELLHRLEQGDP